MNRLLLSACCGLLMVPAMASASQGTVASSEPAATADAAKPSKMRCKQQPVIGTRVAKTVCRTEEQWAATERGAREFMRDVEGTPRRDRHLEANGGPSTPTGGGI